MSPITVETHLFFIALDFHWSKLVQVVLCKCTAKTNRTENVFRWLTCTNIVTCYWEDMRLTVMHLPWEDCHCWAAIAHLIGWEWRQLEQTSTRTNLHKVNRRSIYDNRADAVNELNGKGCELRQRPRAGVEGTGHTDTHDPCCSDVTTLSYCATGCYCKLELTVA